MMTGDLERVPSTHWAVRAGPLPDLDYGTAPPQPPPTTTAFGRLPRLAAAGRGLGTAPPRPHHNADVSPSQGLHQLEGAQSVLE